LIIDSPGIVTKRITMLGRRESCVYLLNGGKESAILGGGMTYIIPDILDQLNRFDIDEKKIKFIIIHHSHIDHVGIVPYFKKKWPWVKIAASEMSRRKLRNPKLIQAVNVFNRSMLEMSGYPDKAQEFGLVMDSIDVDTPLSEGDTITLGNMHMEILETPGHSSCSIAVYVPEEKALFASDAGGIPFGGKVLSAANSNFDLYQQSLEKMARLDVDVHLAEHYGAFTGADGKDFIKRSIESARMTRQLIEKIYLKTRDENKTVQEITDLLMKEATDYFLPREVMSTVVAQMTGYIARALSG